MVEIVVPFARIESINPNVKSKNYKKALSVYYKTICVCFFSLKKFNPEAKLVLVTNVLPEEQYLDFLGKLEIEIRILEYSFLPPESFGPLFRGSFYLLDAIENCKNDTLFLDPDIMCIRAIPFERLSYTLMCFEMPFELNENLNGISRIQAQRIYSGYTGYQSAAVQIHLGGECIFVGKGMEKFRDEIRCLWEYNASSRRFTAEFLPTEEHLLSVLCPKYEYKFLNFLIARIWTGFKYRLIPSVEELEIIPLLHLPAEKSKAFSQFYWLVSKFPSIFINMGDKSFRKFVFWKFHLNSRARKLFFGTYTFFSN
jgi:hypothetical protein